LRREPNISKTNSNNRNNTVQSQNHRQEFQLRQGFFDWHVEANQRRQQQQRQNNSMIQTNNQEVESAQLKLLPLKEMARKKLAKLIQIPRTRQALDVAKLSDGRSFCAFAKFKSK
jgi:hypothetical protein